MKRCTVVMLVMVAFVVLAAPASVIGFPGQVAVDADRPVIRFSTAGNDQAERQKFVIRSTSGQVLQGYSRFDVLAIATCNTLGDDVIVERGSQRVASYKDIFGEVDGANRPFELSDELMTVLVGKIGQGVKITWQDFCEQQKSALFALQQHLDSRRVVNTDGHSPVREVVTQQYLQQAMQYSYQSLPVNSLIVLPVVSYDRFTAVSYSDFTLYDGRVYIDDRNHRHRNGHHRWRPYHPVHHSGDHLYRNSYHSGEDHHSQKDGRWWAGNRGPGSRGRASSSNFQGRGQRRVDVSNGDYYWTRRHFNSGEEHLIPYRSGTNYRGGAGNTRGGQGMYHPVYPNGGRDRSYGQSSRRPDNSVGGGRLRGSISRTVRHGGDNSPGARDRGGRGSSRP